MAMWNPLRRLFGDRASTQVPAPAARPVASPAATVSPGIAAVPAAAAEAVDRADHLPLLAARFTAGLLGGARPSAQPPSAPEREAIDRLQALVAQGLDASSVPRLPAVLPRLMALARREDVAPRELAEVLMQDPALVGDVVRLANSPRYRTQRPIEDLTGALMMLGQLGLSQLVMRAAVRPIFQGAQGPLGQTSAARLRELSDRCSHASGTQGSGTTDAFGAYLAGTAAPVGLMVALRVLDRGAPLAGPGSEAFHAGLWRASLALSAQAARAWAFPDDVVRALENLSGPAMGAAEAAADPATRALWDGLAAALRQLVGPAAADIPASSTEAALVDTLDRVFAREAGA